MTTILQYTPGRTSTIFQEVKDGYGVRTDDGYVPVVSRIIVPGFTLATGYPQTMTRFDTGLYYFQFVLPSGASGVGSYLVDIVYMDPVSSKIVSSTVRIVCTAPFGNFGVTIGHP